jgi:hypothetical protein
MAEHEDETRPTIEIGANLARSEDGSLYDPDTGEVIDEVIDEIIDEKPGLDGGDRDFHIESPEAADWVLKLIATDEARLAEIETRRAALLANLDSMEVGPRNRLSWLHHRFDAELIAQAERDIAEAGGKCKTAKYPHGQVSLRKTAGKASIVDMHRAVRFVEEWAPDHIKKTVGIEAVKLAIRHEAEAIEPGDETDTRRFFKSAEPSERWSIETGIGLKRGEDK